MSAMMRLRGPSRATKAFSNKFFSGLMAPRCMTRFMSTDITKYRNIGISAHIDSGKTTLTERILFYTGRIHAIHDVKGKDGVGAKMDSMDLEREKGITIQSAATHAKWNDHHINLIDTPGHVDFTIEVERALRVLDGAVLVLCGVAGVQSQSITVDRQMKRYDVPRVAFINKLDRMGANPWKPIQDMQDMLQLNAAAVQVPIGYEGDFCGVVDLITRKCTYFEGENGENLRVTDEIPEDLQELVEEKRALLVEKLSDVDETLEEMFLMEEEPTEDDISKAIRRCTIDLKFVPVFMGSAFKNKGVQSVLDGVVDYLPNPTEVRNVALDQDNDEKEVVLKSDPKDELVALAFKLEDNKFGQLTYMRIYSGQLKRRDQIVNVSSGSAKKIAVPRLVRMHSNDMEELEEAGPGEIVAMFGVDCVSGSTFTSGKSKLSMTSMFVPNPVISLSIRPKEKGSNDKFSKAIARFQREDPTFRVHMDEETQETIISGMGELHLEVYAARIEREYGVECVLGRPQVAYREACTQRVDFDYQHKKQTGGSGQYGRLMGFIEPLEEMGEENFVFENQLTGNAIDPGFYNAIEKGFQEAAQKGPIAGNQVRNVRVVILDGVSHAVDSSELAFRLTAQGAFRDAFKKANPSLLEPVMNVDVEAPTEFQAQVVAGQNQRKGMIQSVDAQSGVYCKVNAHTPLSQMFGYSTDLRSSTQGKGEFSMEFAHYQPVPRDEQTKIAKAYQELQAARNK